ncbi:hypothetical protein RJ639_046384, partial [Escallonia herrerae]
IKQLNVQHIEKPRLIHNLNSTWVKPVEIINEPRCIAVDEGGSRLFLSDTNHHRIIIGSSPGFEDGEFESAKLMRPAASFYHDGEDCLYIVDSEPKITKAYGDSSPTQTHGFFGRPCGQWRGKGMPDINTSFCGILVEDELWNFVDDGFEFRSYQRRHQSGDILSEIHADHVQRFSLLPGRVDIQLNVDIPEDTELVEPLHENCIWRQARGTATEVSQEESRAASAEKVGVAQQFYNDLDSLAFSTPELESSTEKEQTTSGKVLGGRLCIECAVNTSPGTSEVFISAALYLKLRKSVHKMEEKTARMADVLLRAETRNLRNNPGIQFLSTTNTDLGQLIFMRPLHVRLHIECRDHPKADNGRDIILTDSSIEVNVALN